MKTFAKNGIINLIIEIEILKNLNGKINIKKHKYL
jgi:hypothetical protein